MICLGSPQSSPTPFESEAAQLRVVELFRRNFLARYPDGIVISELEFMGRTTAAPSSPGPLRLPGRGNLNQVLDALSTDFRRWMRDRDFRKCDALGINGTASYAELLEVTTIDNAASAVTQLASKLAILRETVNRIHVMSVDWRPSLFRPDASAMFYALPSAMSEVRYLCFYPTLRLPAPPGVVLYEVHVMRRPTVPVPVQIPDEAADKLRQAYRTRRPTQDSAESWARRFVRENPTTGLVLRGLAYIFGAVLVVAAIVLIFDPVPGDEAAAGAAAVAVLAFARGQ
jgi:hypothetical protein